MSNFSSVQMVFCWFFIWIAVGIVDLHFLSFFLVTKANGLEGGTASAAW